MSERAAASLPLPQLDIPRGQIVPGSRVVMMHLLALVQ